MAEIIRWPRHVLYSAAETVTGSRVFRICRTCGAADKELATECPGHRLHPDEFAAVRNGHIDFIKGHWQPRWQSSMDPAPRHR